MKLLFFPFVFLFFAVQVAAQPKIGLQLYSFRAQLPKDPAGMLKKIAALGITEVEGGDSYGLYRENFRDLLEKNKLKTISIGASFEQLDSNLDQVIDKAKFYGATYVMCPWIPHTRFDQSVADKAVTVLDRAGKLLLGAGFQLCYHTHGFEFVPWTGNKTLFDYLILKTNPLYVNFEMDVFWVKSGGQDPVTLLNRYPKRFTLLHLKDRLKGTVGDLTGHADEETNVVLGTGDLDIAAIMRTARRIGVRHYFIEDESTRSEAQLPESLEFLRNIKYKTNY